MATKSLYVGNLSYNTTEDELRALYAPYGPVAEVRIIAGRGFGFVDIPEENVSAAIEATTAKDFQGRTLNVSEAKPRVERSSASYAGSRGGAYSGGGRRSGGGSGDRW